MELAADLLDILVCPESKQPLIYFPKGETNDDEASAFLLCEASQLKYRLEDGIPVLLVEEAERLDDAETQRLVARAKQLGL